MAGGSLDTLRAELGLERIVKLASNEHPLGPTAPAREALARAAADAHRYPDSDARVLREALAGNHGVAPEQLVAGAGGDGCIDALWQASLEPGDEVVCAWPSFITYVTAAARRGATVRHVPLRDHVHDLDAMLDAITPRTKLLVVCHPNNPTGTSNGRAAIEELLDAVPRHVLTVLDQAYFEYVTDPDYPDAIDYLTAGRRVAVVRTFSKIHGLAGLRVGYLVAPPEVIQAVKRIQRPFDVAGAAQAAAIASLGAADEIAGRRGTNRAQRTRLIEVLSAHGLTPVPGPVANFVYVETGCPGRDVADALLRQGVVVRALTAFGAPDAVRISVGSREDHRDLERALGAIADPPWAAAAG